MVLAINQSIFDMMSMVCKDSKYNSLYQLISNEISGYGTQTLDQGMLKRVVYHCATAAGQGFWLKSFQFFTSSAVLTRQKAGRFSVMGLIHLTIGRKGELSTTVPPLPARDFGSKAFSS